MLLRIRLPQPTGPASSLWAIKVGEDLSDVAVAYAGCNLDALDPARSGDIGPDALGLSTSARGLAFVQGDVADHDLLATT